MILTKRLYEWTSTAIFMAIGAALALPVKTMDGPLFAPLLALWPEKTWAAFFLAVGGGRAIALVVNGRAPKGSPAVRAAAATLCGVVYSLVATSFIQAGPIGLWAGAVYGVLTVSEVIIVYRAVGELTRAVHRYPA